VRGFSDLRTYTPICVDLAIVTFFIFLFFLTLRKMRFYKEFTIAKLNVNYNDYSWLNPHILCNAQPGGYQRQKAYVNFDYIAKSNAIFTPYIREFEHENEQSFGYSHDAKMTISIISLSVNHRFRYSHIRTKQRVNEVLRWHTSPDNGGCGFVEQTQWNSGSIKRYRPALRA
jgi:hypothetical protein